MKLMSCLAAILLLLACSNHKSGYSKSFIRAEYDSKLDAICFLKKKGGGYILEVHNSDDGLVGQFKLDIDRPSEIKYTINGGHVYFWLKRNNSSIFCYDYLKYEVKELLFEEEISPFFKELICINESLFLKGNLYGFSILNLKDKGDEFSHLPSVINDEIVANVSIPVDSSLNLFLVKTPADKIYELACLNDESDFMWKDTIPFFSKFRLEKDYPLNEPNQIVRLDSFFYVSNGSSILVYSTDGKLVDSVSLNNEVLSILGFEGELYVLTVGALYRLDFNNDNLVNKEFSQDGSYSSLFKANDDLFVVSTSLNKYKRKKNNYVEERLSDDLYFITDKSLGESTVWHDIF